MKQRDLRIYAIIDNCVRRRKNALLKPATHLAILYADRGEFDRQRKSPAIFAGDWCGHTWGTHFFADRGDVAVLKSHVIKSPSQLYWRFAAMSVENRGNEHTWRMLANLIADIWHARYQRFYTPIAAIGENRNRCTGHTWRFSPIAANLIASENRQRFSLAIDADTPGDFFRRSRRCGSFENSCDKSPNLMGWLYWRFAAINVENRGNGHTWRMPANLIADIWHTRYRRFYTPIAAIGKNRNRCTGHTWRFSPIAAIGV